MPGNTQTEQIATRILNAVPLPGAVVSPDGRFQHVNPAFSARFPGRQTGSVNEIWTSPPADLEAALRAAERGEEVEVRGTIGQTTHLAARLSRSEAGVLIFFYAENVTVPSERNITSARYRDLLRHSPMSIQILDPKGRTLWVNEAFEKLWGLRLADLATFNVLEDPILVEQGLTAMLRKAFDGEVTELPPRAFEVIRRTETDVTYEVREVRARAYPVHDDAQRLVEVVITHEDVTETAVAQKKTVSTQNRLQMVLDAVGAGVWVYHVKSDRLEWSPEQHRLLGLADGVAPSIPLFASLIHPADREMARMAFERTTGSGERLNLEFRMLLPTRGERWIASVGHVRRNLQGEVERVVGINFDVTERIIATQALQRTEGSLALAMKGGRMGYWTRDLSLRNPNDRVEWSPELEAVFGIPGGSFEGTEWDFLRRVHPEDRDRLRSAVGQALQSREEYSVEFRYIHASGAVRWMEGRGRATYDESGRPLRIDGIGIDITPQKQAEEALRRSEERFRRLANAVPTFVWTANAEGVVDYVNEQWERYTGLPVSSTLDGSWRSARHPDDFETSLVAWQKALTTGQPFRTESRFRRTDGVYRWFLSHAEPLRNRQGEITGWFGTGTDIHDQKRTEVALRFLLALGEQMRQLETPEEILQMTERLLRRHLEANRCIYAELDEETNGEIIDIRFEDCEGCASFLGRYPLAGFGPDVTKLLHGGETVTVGDASLSPITSDSLPAYEAHQIAAFIAVPLIKADRLVAVLAVHQIEPREWTFEDVELVQTVADRCWAEIARARASRQLAQSELLYREIAETLPQIVWSTRPDGSRDYANLRWREFVGEEMAGRIDHAVATIHPDDLDSALEAWEESFQSGRPYEHEHRMRRFDGQFRWFLVRAVPIRNSDGVLVRWFATATDIHEQKEAEAELEHRVSERTAELRAANRELEGFTYTVSHDLRAPLRAIAGASMMLLEDLEPSLTPEQVRLLIRQAENAKRLDVLIDDLLHFSRMSRVELETRPTDLSEMLRMLVSERTEVANDPPHRVDITPTRLASVDAKLIRFVLENLLGNAIKFSPEGALIQFGQRSDGAYFIRDHGIGFDVRYAEKIFEPFERLVTEDQFPGTGIGLANVKRIIERHGGQVWAESTPNEGATFFFRVPLA